MASEVHLVCFKSPWPCRTSGEGRDPLAVVLAAETDAVALAAESDAAVLAAAAVRA